MQFPRIHLNGSHGPDLRQSYIKAMHAVHDAMVALQQIDLNARDYYPLGASAFTVACDESRARYKALATVHAQLEEIAENITEQMP